MYEQQKVKIGDWLQQQIAPQGRAVFPETVERAVMAVVKSHAISLHDGSVAELGAYWDQAQTDSLTLSKLNALTNVVHELGEQYRTRNVAYGEAQTLGYAVNYLPKNFPKIQFILLDLYRKSLLPNHFRLLDIGTGVGTVPLAVLHFLQLLDAAHEQYGATRPDIGFSCTGVDISGRNLEMFRAIAERLDACEHSRMLKYLCAQVDSSGQWVVGLPAEEYYDLIFFSNFFAELPQTPTLDKATIVTHAAARLHRNGKIVIIEPADKDGAINYHALRTELLRRGYHDLCPCSSVGASANCEQCWTFRGEPLRAPTILPSAAKHRYYGSVAADEDVKWCYGIIGLYKFDVDPPLTQLRTLGKPGDRVNNLQVRIVSSNKPYCQLCGAENNSRIAYLVAKGRNRLPVLHFGEVVRFRNLYIRERSASQAPPHEYRLVYDEEPQVSRELIW